MRRDYQFPPDVMAEVRDGMFEYPHRLVQQRLEIIWLKSHGLTDDQIARITQTGRRSVQRYLAAYHDGGIAALKQLNFPQKTSELQNHHDTLEQYFRDNPPRTTAEAQAEIERLTGVKRGLTQVRRFLKRSLGMGWRKTGFVPGKADPDVQAQFLETHLSAEIAEAKAGQRTLLFVDAAHFQFGAILSYVWCVARIFLRIAPNHKRWSVLGALNPFTMETVWVSTAGAVNADTVKELVRRVREKYPNGPITLVMDNAKYQTCHFVNVAVSWYFQVDLLYLPAYSPNLNLIERLWKFMRKKVLAARPCASFEEFSQKIDQAMSETATTHREALQTLITTEFQSFKNVPTLAA